MKTLTLIRHAKSDWGDGETRDHDRRINDRGRSDASSMGRVLAAAIGKPAVVIGSTARRVDDTLALLLDATGSSAPANGSAAPHRLATTGNGLSPRLDERLYLADGRTILDIAGEMLAIADSVWLCAHNPGLSEAVTLATGIELGQVPTLAVAHIGFGDVDALHAGRLLMWLVPRAFRT